MQTPAAASLQKGGVLVGIWDLEFARGQEYLAGLPPVFSGVGSWRIWQLFCLGTRKFYQRFKVTLIRCFYGLQILVPGLPLVDQIR